MIRILGIANNFGAITKAVDKSLGVYWNIDTIANYHYMIWS